MTKCQQGRADTARHPQRDCRFRTDTVNICLNRWENTILPDTCRTFGRHLTGKKILQDKPCRYLNQAATKIQDRKVCRKSREHLGAHLMFLQDSLYKASGLDFQTKARQGKVGDSFSTRNDSDCGAGDKLQIRRNPSSTRPVRVWSTIKLPKRKIECIQHREHSAFQT